MCAWGVESQHGGGDLHLLVLVQFFLFSRGGVTVGCQGKSTGALK